MQITRLMVIYCINFLFFVLFFKKNNTVSIAKASLAYVADVLEYLFHPLAIPLRTGISAIPHPAQCLLGIKFRISHIL